ncbi:MAG: Amuc_1102 family pilus-like protein [Verrucomicrobiales bacterium]
MKPSPNPQSFSIFSVSGVSFISRLSCVVVAALVLTLPQPGQGQQGQQGYAIKTISPAFIKTPNYTFRGDDKRTPSPLEWMEVEVEFQAEPEFTDELTFRYYILMNQQLMVGEVTHANIPQGTSLFSVAYVSPRSLARIMAGQRIISTSIDQISVEITRQGALLATKDWKDGFVPQWWNQLPQVQGMVLRKSDTPFAPLWWDRYEAEKPGGAR